MEGRDGPHTRDDRRPVDAPHTPGALRWRKGGGVNGPAPLLRPHERAHCMEQASERLLRQLLSGSAGNDAADCPEGSI